MKSVVTHSLNLQQYGFRSVADPTWKRPPGRPRTKWTDQLRRDNNNAPNVGASYNWSRSLESDATVRADYDAIEICLVIVLYILVKPVLIKTMLKSINSVSPHYHISLLKVGSQ